MGDVGLGEHSAIGLHYSIGTQGGAPAWREAGGIHDGPLFRRIRRGDHVARRTVDHPSARGRRRDRRARVRPHSLRIGAAQSLAAAGALILRVHDALQRSIATSPRRHCRVDNCQWRCRPPRGAEGGERVGGQDEHSGARLGQGA